MIRDIGAEVIDEQSFDEYLKDHKIYFFGDGAMKCEEILGKHENALFVPDLFPSASYMAAIAFERFQKGEFVDVAYFEPFYLKDFIAGKPKVKGLR